MSIDIGSGPGAFLHKAEVNLLLFDLGVWTFNVRVPTSAINQGAALSRYGLAVLVLADSAKG